MAPYANLQFLLIITNNNTVINNNTTIPLTLMSGWAHCRRQGSHQIRGVCSDSIASIESIGLNREEVQKINNTT